MLPHSLMLPISAPQALSSMSPPPGGLLRPATLIKEVRKLLVSCCGWQTPLGWVPLPFLLADFERRQESQGQRTGGSGRMVRRPWPEETQACWPWSEC